MVPLRLVLGLALAFAASAAAAHDYIVVASNDPAVARGQGVDAGARLTVAAGRTVTLMYASGDLVTLKGMPGGVMAPARRASSAEAQRLEVLRMMVGPPPATGQTHLAKTRGGVCPAPEGITTLDEIVAFAQGGCAAEARVAFEAWLTARLKS